MLQIFLHVLCTFDDVECSKKSPCRLKVQEVNFMSPNHHSKKYEKLARQLAGIINDSDTPPPIVEALLSSLAYTSSFLNFRSEEVIQMCLQSYDERGKGEVPPVH